ncbi:excisionase family DNA-binding protein [Jeotgalibacillus sp. ET6]|uniref:excisionase family DNA-binding protein n=1 Tax=Jeotgalibacillus sp. ET6 TaxID=3037260 RepID=UPI0024184AC6|nr:excisionase family DNA-binding protein [Jeotgalibacillus sp. ET6]MDG5472639.1 excisionase family DNA-binding protein [Jeotgalibacillus sp. ET6]
MYITIKEASVYLSLPEAVITRLIHENKIRAVHDGTHYLVNKEQFNHHLKQLEKAKKLLEEWRNEPIPDSIDVKDED